MSTSSRKLVRTTQAIAEQLGVRFCTKCHLTRATFGGKTKPLANGRSRWECAECVEKTKAAASQKKQEKETTT